MNIGVDIEKVSRFKKFKNKNNVFLNKIFTGRELAFCFSQASVAEHLAARFCAKEAVLKALNGWPSIAISRKEIEILNQPDGKPLVKIRVKPRKRLDLAISLSHTDELAIAFAIVL